MIELDVRGYCQDCLEFEPQVVQRPRRLDSLSGNSIALGDTIVACEHLRHCEALYNHLKRKNDTDS